MAKREHLIQVRMTQKEFAMAEALSGSFGDVSMPDVMRQCLRLQFAKAFPIYARKGDEAGAGVPKNELTPEQMVEMCGGKVTRHEGISVAEFKDGARTSRLPMSLIGFGDWTFDKLKKRYVGA